MRNMSIDLSKLSTKEHYTEDEILQALNNPSDSMRMMFYISLNTKAQFNDEILLAWFRDESDLVKASFEIVLAGGVELPGVLIEEALQSKTAHVRERFVSSQSSVPLTQDQQDRILRDRSSRVVAALLAREDFFPTLKEYEFICSKKSKEIKEQVESSLPRWASRLDAERLNGIFQPTKVKFKHL